MGWAQFELVCEGLLAAEGLDGLDWQGRADELRWAVAPSVAASLAPGLPGPVLVAIAWVSPVAQLAGRLMPMRGLNDVRSLLAVTNRANLIATDFARPAALLGPVELTRLIRKHPHPYRVWPSLLGVCDLSQVLDAEGVKRSSWDEAAARALAARFVATRAYRAAVERLERHRFAVLTGPPEMGKTAIARTLGLVLQSEGWEVHECIRPDQVWQALAADRRQLFIADDAFGSTEYRPDAAERWAVELDRILSSLDDRHWLIWTSRPAPLKAGLGRLHRENGIERFPQPAEVHVDASALDIEEKALILYRHAHTRHLPAHVVGLVRARGARIVEHPHFTPERINRFVQGRLATLSEGDFKGLLAAIDSEIGEPTEAMTASFNALSPEHRAVLVALVDQPPGPVSERDLAQAARRHAPAGLSRPPRLLIDRLTDHFIRVVPPNGLTWVHPSWRDLVINALASDPGARTTFLHRCSLDGVLLALSRGGGATGRRERPLLVRDADWDALSERAYDIVPELGDRDLLRLLASLQDALRSTPADNELQAFGTATLDRISHCLSRDDVYATTAVLNEWFQAAFLLNEQPGTPESKLWEESDHYQPRWVAKDTPFIDQVATVGDEPPRETASKDIIDRILADL